MTIEAALWTVITVLSVLVIVLTLLVVGLLRRAAPVLERAEHLLAAGATTGANVLEGLLVGKRVGPFVVNDVAGRPAVAGDILTGPRTLVVLLSTHCEPCRHLSQQMSSEAWATPAARLVVIQSVEPGANPLPVGADAQLYVQGAGQEASAAFGSNITPHAFVVDRDATVLAKAIPESLTQLRVLATQLAAPVAVTTRESDGHHHHARSETSGLEAPLRTPQEAASGLSPRPTQMR